MVPMTPATSSPAVYQAARHGLDAINGVVTMVATASFALVIFHNTRPTFAGGIDGRVAFTALVAVVVAYGTNGLFDTFFGGLRDRLIVARLDLLIEAAKDARERHAKAQAAIDMGASHLPPYLAVLEAAADKAEDRALRAGALPAELS